MDVTERFTGRVANYVRARPGYPPELLTTLGVCPDWAVADVGSGTGLLSRIFLDQGHTVYGLEPNEAMRSAGEAELKNYPHFHSHPGRAEETGLPSASVDLVVAGQAFHWFDPDATRREWDRILRGPRLVGLVWNDRNRHTPFEEAYVSLIEELAPEYRALRCEPSAEDALQAFLPFQKATFQGFQELDEAALRARLYSSSCMPEPSAEVDARIQQLFVAHQRDGHVRLTHTTRLFWSAC